MKLDKTDRYHKLQKTQLRRLFHPFQGFRKDLMFLVEH